MHRVHSDVALFTYVKEGKLHGIITTHSDDLIMAGTDKFEKEVTSKLQDIFQFSKIEENGFKYCGCNIQGKEDGTIELDQNDYIEKLEEMDVPDGDDYAELSKHEIKSVIGKIIKLYPP